MAEPTGRVPIGNDGGDAHASRWYIVAAFIFPLCIYLLSLNTKISSDYPASILGTQYALWEYHSFSLGTSGTLIVQTVDKGLLNGCYYSAISPGFAVLSLPFAGLGFILDGGSFTQFGYAALLDEVFLCLAASLAVVVVYKVCRFYASPAASLLAALSLAFGTSVWPFATVIFIHEASLLFAVVALYAVLKVVREGRSSWLLLLAGASLGVSCFVEYFAILLFFPFLAYLALSHVKWRSGGLLALGSPTAPVLHFSYNYLAFRNPLIFPEQLKSGAASLLSQFSLSGLLEHVGDYLGLPYRGILFLAPVALIGFYGIYKMAGDPDLLPDGLLFLSSFLVILLAYSSWQDWAGGMAYGPRFLILAMPFLCIPISFVLTSAKGRGLLLFFVTFVISSFVEGTGALTSAFSVAGNSLDYQLLELNLPWLLQGRLNVWWLSDASWGSALTQLCVMGLFGGLWAGIAFLTFWLWLPKSEGVA